MNITVALPSFRVGGWTSHAINVGRGLRARGHRLTALVTDPFGPLCPQVQEAYDAVTVVRRGCESRRGFLNRLVEHDALRNADVLLNNGVPFVQATFPYVPHCVRMSIVHSPLKYEVAVGAANRDAMECAVAVSPNVRDRLARTLNAQAIRLIPPGVVIPGCTRRARSQIGPLRLAYVGRITLQAKNLVLLESVAERLFRRRIPFELLIAGDGDYLRTMKRNARNSEYGRTFRFLGSLMPDQVAALLDECDVLLLTSTYEGSPHAVIEAMAHGVVPVVSRLTGATDFVVGDGVSGYLCSNRCADEFVERITTLSDRPDLLQAMGEAARAEAANRFGIPAIAREYESLFGVASTERCWRTLEPTRRCVSEELLPYCAEWPRQMRRLGGDLYRRVAKGMRPVKVEY